MRCFHEGRGLKRGVGRGVEGRGGSGGGRGGTSGGWRWEEACGGFGGGVVMGYSS